MSLFSHFVSHISIGVTTKESFNSFTHEVHEEFGFWFLELFGCPICIQLEYNDNNITLDDILIECVYQDECFELK